MAAAGGNGPLAPYMRHCPPRRCFEWWMTTPRACRCIFWEGWGCVWPSKHSFVPAMMNCHNIGVFWGPYTTSTAPKIISACSGGCHPSILRVGAERKASMWGTRGQFPLAVAMVGYGCVGSWRLTSDQPTVRKVKIVYGSIFYSYVDPIHSWHLTRQLNKEDLDLRT